MGGGGSGGGGGSIDATSDGVSESEDELTIGGVDTEPHRAIAKEFPSGEDAARVQRRSFHADVGADVVVVAVVQSQISSHVVAVVFVTLLSDREALSSSSFDGSPEIGRGRMPSVDRHQRW
mmetsp:Transcript_32723/g.68600  ORF Transcript_32723/g.68600 Transcript_32723/m.68600 type:complete len:121 (+) Transcript_32723:2221-2583(+)